MIFTGDIAQPYIGASTVNIPEVFCKSAWFGNLEGSFVEGEGFTGVYNNYDAVAKLCKQIRFKAFNLANNHLLDAADVKTTLINLKNLGVPAVGGGCDLKESGRHLLFTDSDGKVYRILAFGWENIQCRTATEKREGVNPYARKHVLKSVEEALKHGEPVVCFMHWNYELERYPQPYDRKLAHDLIDMGVAAVVGCHAHRVQPVEFYKGKPIVYGLGNFLFCQGHYFGKKLCFPRFCEDEYAFEMAGDGYKLHYLKYDQSENRLEYLKSAEIGPDCEFDGKAEFSEMTDKEYEVWFREHRVQKKLLPVFKATESALSYACKSYWIKARGMLINILTKLNLKSANRSERK